MVYSWQSWIEDGVNHCKRFFHFNFGICSSFLLFICRNWTSSYSVKENYFPSFLLCQLDCSLTKSLVGLADMISLQTCQCSCFHYTAPNPQHKYHFHCQIPQRAWKRFRQVLSTIDPKFASYDETSFELHMMPHCGYSAKGTRDRVKNHRQPSGVKIPFNLK